MFSKLSEVIEYYQEYHLTKNKYQYRADNLRFFDAYNLKDLRKKDVKQYAQFRRVTVSNATINRECSFARAAINRVNEDYELKINNPFENVKFIEDDYIANYLNRSQYERLLKSALETDNNDLHDFIVLLTMTGCRPIELLTLKWSNVHLDKHQFIVRNHYSKSKRTMYKYLNNTALMVLLERHEQAKSDYVFANCKTGDRVKSYSKGFQLCKKRAGVNCTMYDLRHTYASWLIQKGVGIYTIKDLLGHGDIESTMRYAHLDYAQYVEAVDLLD
ncbi:site-specific integrase [Psychrobacter sp. NG254]|uniref:tyrosine-type recombinase/integrase n=1 Tax=Psychrobacter sp. NG254 TaxID=2782003 RepID=UPI00188751B4|nr:site-specific integrase [Psychrobacter sp. NG254]MBF2720643.1 site-specific integrase [Psychrobacter sp. NG254]MBF2720652.1 site-specific integrase [Psychrobacter sp. NG254]